MWNIGSFSPGRRTRWSRRRTHGQRSCRERYIHSRLSPLEPLDTRMVLSWLWSYVGSPNDSGRQNWDRAISLRSPVWNPQFIPRQNQM